MFSVFRLESKFLLYHVANYQTNKKLETYSHKILATLRGVAGPHPFFWQKYKLGILTIFLLPSSL